jgi:argininosuccinate lyase
MKLWKQKESINKKFERFTIGKDPELDVQLAWYDVQGSIAHAEMLGSVGLLEASDVEQLVVGLKVIAQQIENGQFKIEAGIEDCHSQIELQLTRKLGDIGKKIHSGRSRNDQVLTALKLFSKDKILELAASIRLLFNSLIEMSDRHRDVLIPGYTHMQVAMPSSMGLWLAAYAESLVDDLVMLRAAFEISDKNPLGSAAGYGSSFPLDREETTTRLGFDQLNVNSIYAQMTRGKMEKSIAFAINSIASTLAKFAMDVCLYSGQDFGFIKVDKKYATGSSIMPHKNNPDGFELVRAKCNKLQALPYELNLILTNLPSGYHRDLQVLKESFVPAFITLKDCIDITTAMTSSLEVLPGQIENAKYDLIFSVEEVNRLVNEGIPFRDAYHQVSTSIKEGKFKPNRAVEHTHVGSIGNLGNERIVNSFEKAFAFFSRAT